MSRCAVTWSTQVSAADIADVDAMLDRVLAADGVSALSEHTYLHLLSGGGNGDRHGIARSEGDVVGYAYVSADERPVAEFLVDPAARSRGLGRQLLAEVLAEAGPGVRIWAHGQLPAAAALAQEAGMVAVRGLCRYTRPLDAVPEVTLPAGITLRAFRRGDEDDWLQLNAQAFADLPDQGSWTAEDLAQRLAQPWFDPQGFLLAFDNDGLAGFHWTKVHGGDGHAHERTGEVYVLAVADRARGTGLGRALTAAGLQHLQRLGLGMVMLYVDVDNRAAVAMYEGLGFRRADCDVQYAFATR